MGKVREMCVRVEALELQLQRTKRALATREELATPDLDRLRAWRLESALRFVGKSIMSGQR
jgi:hypothetical protein